MKEISMYTDGACKGNPGPGGYCCILNYAGHEKVISGGEPNTTNNRMELLAVISGLQALKEHCAVQIYSDSKYVVDAISLGWAEKWKARNWKKPDGKPAQNPDLWDLLLQLLSCHDATFHWVKGHDGHEYNERCDRTAVAESEKFII